MEASATQLTTPLGEFQAGKLARPSRKQHYLECSSFNFITKLFVNFKNLIAFLVKTCPSNGWKNYNSKQRIKITSQSRSWGILGNLLVSRNLKVSNERIYSLLK